MHVINSSPLHRTLHDLWWGSDSSFPVVKGSELCFQRSQMSEKKQALTFGSGTGVWHSEVAVSSLLAGRFGDICSTTAIALFSCSCFLHSSTYREKFTFSSIAFMKVIWSWNLWGKKCWFFTRVALQINVILQQPHCAFKIHQHNGYDLWSFWLAQKSVW